MTIRSRSVDVTRAGRGATGGGTSLGETAGAGSLFSAVITERPNTSNNRNQGPSRASTEIGQASLPVVTSEQRNTGRVR